MTARAFALAVALLAVLAPTAAAEPTVVDVQGAQAWWAEQGVTDAGGCPDGVTVQLVDIPAEEHRNGYAWNCVVTLATIPRYFDGVPIEDGWDYGCGGYLRNFMRHEVGHTLGLMHTDMVAFPIMDPVPAVESVCPPSAWELRERRKVRASVPEPRMHVQIGRGRLRGKHDRRGGRWRHARPVITVSGG